MNIIDKNVNSEGRKFFFMKNGVLKPYWFALVATFVVEFARQIFLIAGMKEAIDTSLMWGFLKTFTYIAPAGFLLYAGVNVWQKKVLNGNGLSDSLPGRPKEDDPDLKQGD